jgi:hypothetical protein
MTSLPYSGNDGRPFSGNGHDDLENQIYQVEHDAYTGVLRAFKLQSDAYMLIYRIICLISYVFKASRRRQSSALWLLRSRRVWHRLAPPWRCHGAEGVT